MQRRVRPRLFTILLRDLPHPRLPPAHPPAAHCWVQVPKPSPLVVVISGPSGVGKDAVIRRLQEVRPDLHFVVTATSRCGPATLPLQVGARVLEQRALRPHSSCKRGRSCLPACAILAALCPSSVHWVPRVPAGRCGQASSTGWTTYLSVGESLRSG